MLSFIHKKNKNTHNNKKSYKLDFTVEMNQTRGMVINNMFRFKPTEKKKLKLIKKKENKIKLPCSEFSWVDFF